MPSSAKDRFTVDFDYVFFFVKNKKYYFEQQFEALKEESLGRYNYKINGPPGSTYPNEKREQPHAMKGNPNGRNKRAVWHVDESKLHKANDTPWNHNRAGGDGVGLRGTRNMRTTWRINPQPVKDAHFAVFPEKLVEPMIKAGCPSEICDSCGVAFSRENQITREYRENTCSSKYEDLNYNNVNTIATKKFDRSNLEGYTVKKCDCNAPTHSGIVLDPFVGSGTTALVARKLGRHYIGIDLQPDYCDMARTRLAEVL
jgi:DNA modification methylase